VGGTTITAETNVAALIRDTSPGDKVKISWVDAQTGRSHTATVTMGASPLN
jgi:S1-C subfamily serine protease